MKTRRDKERKAARFVNARERAEKAEAASGSSSYKLPKGVGRFSFEENKTYRLNILPYKVGKGNPYADYDPDDPFLHYERTYYTHKGVGADERSVCCPQMTFGKRCPICEYVKGLDRWGKDKELYQALRPKQRQLFALVDLDAPSKGIQILEMSHFFGLGEAIDGKVKAKPKYETFYHPSGGRTLEVTVKKNKQGGVDIQNLEMEERDDLDQDLLDKVPCLDDMPIEMDYKKLKELFDQGGKTEAPDTVDETDDDEEDSETEDSAEEEDSGVEKDEEDSAVEDSDVEDSPLEDDDDDEEEDSETEDSVEEDSPLEDEDEDSDVEDSEAEPAPKKKTVSKKPVSKKTTRK